MPDAVMLHRLLNHPEGADPLTILTSLLDGVDAGGWSALIIAHNGPVDPLPALLGRSIKHFISIDDPVKAVEFAALMNNPALAILGDRFSALLSGGLEGVDTALIEKLFIGSSPEYLELLEDIFPSILSESVARVGADLASVDCVAASLPSQRLARRLPRYLKGASPAAFKYVEEARKSGLGPADMAAYTLGKCLGEGSERTLFIGLSGWGLVTSLLRWSG